MVALAPPNIAFNVQPDPSVVRILVVEIRKANTSDTIDVGSQMTRVGAAMFIGTTVTLRAQTAIAGTVLTLPAGITNDSGYLIVLGL